MELLFKIAKELVVGEQVLQDYSMFKTPPDSHQFSYVSLQALVAIHTTFRFEPMHSLPLGRSKMLEENLLNDHPDQHKTTTPIPFQSGQLELFSVTRTVS